MGENQNGKDPWAQRIEAFQKLLTAVPPLVWIILAIAVYYAIVQG